MVASDLAAAHKQFKQAFDKGDAATCTRLLSNLKLLLAKAGALGVNESTVTANNEDLAMARDVLEHAVFLGIKQEDETMFERNYAQLKTLYAVTRYWVASINTLVGETTPCCAQNAAGPITPGDAACGTQHDAAPCTKQDCRVSHRAGAHPPRGTTVLVLQAHYHFIHLQAQRTGYMRLPIQLEQWLMEGAYNKVGPFEASVRFWV